MPRVWRRGQTQRQDFLYVRECRKEYVHFAKPLRGNRTERSITERNIPVGWYLSNLVRTEELMGLQEDQCSHAQPAYMDGIIRGAPAEL